MHETRIFSSDDETMSFDPVSVSPLGLQNTLREAEHSSLICDLFLVLLFAVTIEEAIEGHLKSVKF